MPFFRLGETLCPDTAQLICAFVFSHAKIRFLHFKAKIYSRALDQRHVFSPIQIEGFLAGEDTTAPVVRRLRRTSQSGFSASQPVMSSAKRQTSAQTSTLESMDTETPRTLIQGFLRNGTVKFLNFWTPKIFAVIYLKFKRRGQTLKDILSKWSKWKSKQ